MPKQLILKFNLEKKKKRSDSLKKINLTNLKTRINPAKNIMELFRLIQNSKRNSSKNLIRTLDQDSSLLAESWTGKTLEMKFQEENNLKRQTHLSLMRMLIMSHLTTSILERMNLLRYLKTLTFLLLMRRSTINFIDKKISLLKENSIRLLIQCLLS